MTKAGDELCVPPQDLRRPQVSTTMDSSASPHMAMTCSSLSWGVDTQTAAPKELRAPGSFASPHSVHSIFDQVVPAGDPSPDSPKAVGASNAWGHQRTEDTTQSLEKERELAFIHVLNYEVGHSGVQASELRFEMQPMRRSLRQLCPLIVGLLAGSSVAFGFASLYFGAIVHGPRESEELPEHFSSWSSCCLSTSRTALGKWYPLHRLSAAIVVPKSFGTAALLVCFSGLVFGIEYVSWWSMISCGVIMVAACGSYGATRNLISELQDCVEPVTLSCQVVGCFYALFIIAPHKANQTVNLEQSEAPDTTTRRIVLCVAATFLWCCLNPVLVLGLQEAPTPESATLEIVGLISICIVVRGTDFFARCLLTKSSEATWIIVVLLFLSQSLNSIALRRSMLTFSVNEVILTSMVRAVEALAFHFVYIFCCVRRYNHLMKKKLPHLALRELNLFLMGVVSNVVAEQVALQASLGTALFVDRRMFNMALKLDRSEVVACWAIQLIFEIISSSIALCLGVASLPLSYTQMLAWSSRMVVLGGFYLVTACYVSLSALSLYINKDAFSC